MMGNKSFVFSFADVKVREREFSLIKAGEVLHVEPKAFRVFLILLRNPQKLITKEELLNSVWGDVAVGDNSLARSIALLRRLLGDDTRNPRYIETVATVGYRLVCPVEVTQDGVPREEVQADGTSGNESEAQPSPDPLPCPPPPLIPPTNKKFRWTALTFAALITLAAVTVFMLRYRTALPSIDGVLQLTD